MRLRVCQIIPTLDQGGAEKQLSLLAQHLDRDRFESHVIVLTHTGPLEQQLRSHGVHVHLIGKRAKVDPRAYWRLTRKLREIAPHVVHTWLFAANSYGRWAAYRSKVPVIIAGERCVDPWKSWWHDAIDRRLRRITDTVVTNTTAVSEFYSRRGMATSDFTVIPNAVVPSGAPKISREQLCRRLGIEPRGKVIGAVGRLWKQKGYRDLIWAGESVNVAYGDVWLVIFGDGPEREQLLQFRDRAGAQEAVRLVGHRQDAAELMSGFDILWNGSLYEGQSNTILEAMSLGIPVIATDIPGNRDLVVNDQTGILYPLGDVGTLTRQTNMLLRSPERWEAMSRQARQRAETEFSLEQMVCSHAALYQRLYEQKS